MIKLGLQDKAFERMAQILENTDLSSQIKEFRQDLSDVGLYYSPENVPLQLNSYTDIAPEEMDQWVMIEGVEKKYTDYISMSNMKSIMRELKNTGEENFVHVQGGEYAVRVFDNAGKLTPAGSILKDSAASLSGYPVLNDDEISQTEYDATIENIESEGYSVVSDEAPEDWAKQVFTWLWKHNQEAFGEHDNETGGQWVEESSIQEAAKELGFALVEEDEFEEEDTEPKPEVIDPRQTSFPFKAKRER